MNRIYQGRVTRVETLNGKSAKGEQQWCLLGFKPEEFEWRDKERERLRPLTEQEGTAGEEAKKKLAEINRKLNEPWQDALWSHHELFQDAVNYYLLALLALANENTPGIGSIKERVASEKKEHEEYHVWQRVKRGGKVRPGMRESVWKYLLRARRSASFEDYCEAVLDGCKASRKLREAALLELLEYCKGDGAIQQEGRAMFPRFCVPNYAGDYPRSASAKAKASAKKWLPAYLHAPETARSLKAVRGRLQFDLFANRDRSGREFSGTEARGRLLVALEWLSKHSSLKAKRKYLEARIKKLSDGITVPAWRGGSVNKEALRQRFYAWLMFRYVKASSLTFRALRASFPVLKKAKLSKTAATKAQPLADRWPDDPIKLARGKRGYVFRPFTNLLTWSGKEESSTFCKEFDVAAFKEALKAFNQIKQKTDERDEERKKKEARLAAMRDAAKHATLKADTEGESERPPLLVEDSRIAQLEKLLASPDFRRRYEMTAGETVDYGLRERTIRGFRELREEWRKIAKDSSFSPELRQRLLDKLREFQKDNPRIVGSVELFEALLDKPNWCIWQKDPTDSRFGDNPLRALLVEKELQREIARLKEPVRFTPADARDSRRQYYFPGYDKATQRAELGHDTAQRSCRVELAVKEGEGKKAVWRKRLVRMHYSAPRLLRDGLRTDEGEKLGDVKWLQPMMEALGMSPGTPQSFEDCPVALMPDEIEQPDGNCEQRFLLNFPITLDPLEVQQKLRHGDPRQLFANRKKGRDIIADPYWRRQCAEFDRTLLYLRWPSVAKKPSSRDWWWNRVKSFRCLAVDLGQRDAGAFAILEAGAGQPTRPVFRFIGKTGQTDWRSTVEATGLLRLPGEDAETYRHQTRLDVERGESRLDPKRDKAFREELYGERGRSVDDPEWSEALEIVEALNGNDNPKKRKAEVNQFLSTDAHFYSFPELNDRLCIAFGWAQSRLARFQSWSWRVKDKKARVKAREEIMEAEGIPGELKSLAEDEKWALLAERTKAACETLRATLQREAVRLANRVVPLRNRHWEWIPRKDGTGCYVLSQSDPSDDEPKRKIRGQRGLSLERLEQLDELRHRLQALNRALLHTPGKKPKHGRGTGGRELPDPCPDLLAKMEQLREQRVKQTAHMILAEALGVRLRAPQKEYDQRAARDIHGEYEPIKRKDGSARPPVDFIVMENLDRYTASQGRARGENSRLMKWCHRQLLLRLKQMATEGYGIPVIEVHAAYSSRFCSRTGVAGFRAVELTPDARKEWQWKRLLERLEKHESGEKKMKPAKVREAKRARALLDKLDEINKDRRRDKATGRWLDAPRTLLAPMPGGPIFVPMAGHTTQADINAAINIGLRAIAAPTCHNILHRIRSIAEEGEFRVRAESKREKARWPRKTLYFEFRQPKSAAELGKGGNPNFFIDAGGVAKFDRARLSNSILSIPSTLTWPLASGRGIWGTVNRLEWRRVNQLNNERLQDERLKHLGEIKLLEASSRPLAWINAIVST